jgi:hypothetical protein
VAQRLPADGRVDVGVLQQQGEIVPPTPWGGSHPRWPRTSTAEQVSRARLRPAQALALRYAGLLLVYLPSTADLFLTGLGRGVQLPIALALLAVAGVLLATLLRVRAFLFLGVTFLSLVVFAQIRHAAVGRAQTWAWWASGIALGTAILARFALFEKRRNDVLKVLDALRRRR